MAGGGGVMSRTERGLPALQIQVVSEGGHCVPCMIAIDATREVTADFGDDVVVEVVTLKEHAGAERYRELRRSAGEHLPVPCVLLEGHLVSPGIPEPEALREVIMEALRTGVTGGGDEALGGAEDAADEVRERLGVAE